MHDFLIHGYRANYQYMMRYADLFLETGCEVWLLIYAWKFRGKVLSWGEDESKYLDKLISKYKSGRYKKSRSIWTFTRGRISFQNDTIK